MQRISCLRYSLYGCICYRTSGGRPSAADWQLAACSNNMVGSNRSKTNCRRDLLPRSAAALARQPKRIQYTGATPQCPAPARISHVQVRSRLHPGCLAPGSHCVNITFSSLKARVALWGEGSAKWFSCVCVCVLFPIGKRLRIELFLCYRCAIPCPQTVQMLAGAVKREVRQQGMLGETSDDGP